MHINLSFKFQKKVSWLFLLSALFLIVTPVEAKTPQVKGVNTLRGGTTTTKSYQFLFADKRDDVHHGEWLSYQVGILNLSSEPLHLSAMGADVNARYQLKNISNPYQIVMQDLLAAPTLQTQGIEWKDIEVPVGGKVIKTFLARIPDKGDPNCLKAWAVVDNDNSFPERQECNSLVPASQKTAISPLDFTRLTPYFKSVFSKNPNIHEEAYWNKRLTWLGDVEKMKKEMEAEKKAKGKNSKILGARSNNLYEMKLSDTVTKSSPGELVTYSVKVTNKYSENTVLTPQLSITAKDLEIPTASDHGRRGKLTNGKPGGTADWNYVTNANQKNRYAVQVDSKKSHTFTFQIKTPDTIGSEYCIEADLFPFLQDRDCNTVVKSTKKQATATSTPKPTPAVKITEKEFRILTPDGLSTDRADQEITWYSTEALKIKYPSVKIELCPGKDFKGCVILEAIAGNDGSQTINMPPVPRVGKWYLHIIGRDSNDGLAPNVATSRLVVLGT